MTSGTFHLQAAVLDSFARLTDLSEDPDGVLVVLDALKKREDVAAYFFSQRPTPAWAQLLFEHGFFSSPPEPEKVDDGYHVPAWRLSQYLVDVAPSVPEVVLGVVNTIQTQNANVCGDLVKALCRIPAHLVTKALDKVSSWVGANLIGWGLIIEVFNLVTYLADNNEIGVALRLFRTLSEPVPSQVAERQGVIGQAEARSRFEEFRSMEPLWLKPLLAIGLKAPEELAQILEAHLIRALELENKARGRPADAPDEWWRSAIEESGQDRFARDYKHDLLLGLRTTLENWLQGRSEPSLAYVRLLLQSDRSFLRRLAIHLARLNPTLFAPEIRDLLTSAANLDDIHIHHEFFLLLKDCYSLLEKDAQDSVLANILQGPDEGRTRELAEHAEREFGESASVYRKRHVSLWIRDRLWMIRENLPPELANKLAELLREFGEPEHPEFLVFSTGFRVTDRSPLSHENFRQMTVEQIHAFVRLWEPPPEARFGPDVLSHEGLADALSEFVLSPDNPGGLIEKFSDLRPTYAYKLFMHLDEKAKSGDPIPWRETLALARAIVALPSERATREDDYADWRGVRTQIANLLDIVLENDQIQLAPDVLEQIRNLLLDLIYDSDPDEQADNSQEGWFGFGDPMTIALNHVRPRALTGLIKYARRWTNAALAASQPPVTRWDPMVKSAITDKLDRTKDPSWSLHSVYGRYLPLFYWLDKEWFEENLERILPEADDEQSARYFAAAWDSYIVNQAQVGLYDRLRSKYHRAILNLSEGKVTRTHLEPDKHLAGHLLSEYLEVDYDLSQLAGDRNLLRLFMEKAPPRARGSAPWLLWQWLSSDEQFRNTKWSRIRAFWAWRSQEASIRRFPADYSEEFTWFAYFPKAIHQIESMDSLWPLLQGLLPYITREDHAAGWKAMEEYLALEVDRDPVNVIKYYRLMHEQSSIPKFLFYDDESEKIMRGALDNPESREQAIALADLLARRKNFQFLELVKSYRG